MATVPKTPRSTTITLTSAIAGPFDLTFRLFDDDSITVFVNGLPRTDFNISSSYTDGFDDNATITFMAPLSSGDVVLVDADLTPGRAQDYFNGPDLVDKINIENGRIWAALADVKRDTKRSARAFEEIDPLQLQPQRALVVNEAGTGLEMGASADEIANAQAYGLLSKAWAVSELSPDGMPDSISSRTAARVSIGAALSVQAAIAQNSGAFVSRAAAIGTSVPAAQQRIAYIDSGYLIEFIADPAGTALVQVDGRRWSPASTVHAEHFGAVGDGVTNDSPAINAALAYGFNVKLLPRKYLLGSPLSIEAQRLDGAGYHFPVMTVTTADDLSGTVLICGFELADYDHVVNLEQDGVIDGLMIYYPDQLKVREPGWTPIQTPWAIVAGTYEEQTRDTRDCHLGISDVCVLDFSHGIRLRKGGERGHFFRIRGNPFTIGLSADAMYDVTRFRDIHFWPFGGNTGGWQLGERMYTLNNGTAFDFGRIDGLVVNDTFCIGYKTGVIFRPCEDIVPAQAGTATTKFVFQNVYLDSGDCSFTISGVFAGTSSVSGHIIGGTMQHWTVDDLVTSPRENIRITVAFADIVMSQVRLSAGGESRKGSLIYVSASKGRLTMTDCTFNRWDRNGLGATGFTAINGAKILLLNPAYYTDFSTPLDPASQISHYVGDVYELDMLHGKLSLGGPLSVALRGQRAAISLGDTDTAVFSDGDGRVGLMANGHIPLLVDRTVVNTPTSPVYANNAAALSGGLVVGDNYRTPTGAKMEVF